MVFFTVFIDLKQRKIRQALSRSALVSFAPVDPGTVCMSSDVNAVTVFEKRLKCILLFLVVLICITCRPIRRS